MAELIRPQQRHSFSPVRRMAQPLEHLRSRLRPATRYIRSRAHEGRHAAASSWLALRRRGLMARTTQQAYSNYAPWFRHLRQWSPGVMPPVFGSLLLLVAALLATRHVAMQRPLIAPNALLPLFIFYLIGGLLWGYLLYVVPNVSWWFCVAAGGMATYLLITGALIDGLPGVVLVGALLVGAAVLYTRRHVANVPNGALQLTISAGGYSRALLPGVAILLPGERIGQTVETGERQYDCPAQRVEVHDESGAIYDAQAAAAVAYHITPQRAQGVVARGGHLEHWEDDTHQAIESALHQALAEWGASHLGDEGEPLEGLLTRTMLALLREWSRDSGVRIEWIKVRDMWLTPASETIPADEWLVGGGEAEKTALSSQAQAPLDVEARAYESAGLSRTQALPSIDHVEQARPSPASPAPPPREALAPEALSDAYDAVREGHILDPATIRDVANAFLRVASDAEQSATFPYDALGAARILLERATSLERASNSRTRANSDFLR
ncbi:MAG: hypothetical protein ACXWQ5_20135 [Ktedonobacterales bacterium]